MPDPITLSGAIQQAAAKTFGASKQAAIFFGTVTSINPLTIETDQKLPLKNKMLRLTRNVTDYEVDIEVSHQTEEKSGGSGDYAYESHRHEYKGRKKIKVYNALVVGDQVVLVRLQGTGTYIVLDRIEPIPELKGEWIL